MQFQYCGDDVISGILLPIFSCRGRQCIITPYLAKLQLKSKTVQLMQAPQWDDEGTAAQCCEIVHFEDGHHLYPGAYYCPKQTEGGISFETIRLENAPNGRGVAKVYPVFKELHKVYHVQLKQFRQSHVSTKLKRFVKIDGKLVDDYEIEDQPISGEIRFHVGDY